MGSQRMSVNLALVFSLVLALTDARPRAKRQASNATGCLGGGIDNDRGTIQIGDGTSYKNNEQCCFTFSPSNYVDQPIQVLLEFEYFDVSTDNECYDDYVTYEDSSGLRDTDCGTHQDYGRIFHSVGWFQLCFHSDDSETARGLRFNYNISPGHGTPEPSNSTGCIGGGFVDNAGTVQIGNGTSYGPNEQCCFTFSPENLVGQPMGVELQFVYFQILEGCEYDYITYEDSNGEMDRDCGTHVDYTRVFHSVGWFQVCFHSDESEQSRGAKFNYYISPATTGFPSHNSSVGPAQPANSTSPNVTATPSKTCSFTSDAMTGEYTLRTDSSGYYAKNEFCTVNLQGPSLPHDTVLDFTHFDVEDHHCMYDYLDVVVGSRIVDKLCGSMGPFSKTYNNSGDLKLVFTSDDSDQKSGFSFKYSHHISEATKLQSSKQLPKAKDKSGIRRGH